MAKKILTDDQVQTSLRFADGAMASAGHFVTRQKTRRDAELVLRGRMTPEAAIARAVRRVKG